MGGDGRPVDVIDAVENETLREVLMVKARDWLAERT